MMFLTDIPYPLEQYVNTAPATSISGVTIVSDTLFDGTVGGIMRCPVGTGFGYTDYPTSNKWLMKISSKIGYEISFFFRQTTTSPSFKLSLTSLSAYNVSTESYNSATGTLETFWVNNTDTVIGIINQWNFARYVLYPANNPLIFPHLTSLSAGRNITMSEATTNIMVNFQCILNHVDLYNFKVKPIMTPFSTGFVQGSDLIEIFRKNNSGRYTEDELDMVASNYLLPYNFANKSIPL